MFVHTTLGKSQHLSSRTSRSGLAPLWGWLVPSFIRTCSNLLHSLMAIYLFFLAYFFSTWLISLTLVKFIVLSQVIL